MMTVNKPMLSSDIARAHLSVCMCRCVNLILEWTNRIGPTRPISLTFSQTFYFSPLYMDKF